jgi:hypothetical protein
MKVSEQVFACYSAACRPPTSGGTGGSRSSGRGGGGQVSARGDEPPRRKGINPNPSPRSEGIPATVKKAAEVAKQGAHSSKKKTGVSHVGVTRTKYRIGPHLI